MSRQEGQRKAKVALNLTMLGLPAIRQAGLGKRYSKKKRHTYPTICLGTFISCFTMTWPWPKLGMMLAHIYFFYDNFIFESKSCP
jgi:hypothetical protein